MDSSIIVAIIGASATITVGGFTLWRTTQKKPDLVEQSAAQVQPGSVTSEVENVADSMVAVGTNINQSFSPTVHHHYEASPSDAVPFAEKVESTPTITEVIDDINKDRKPYEMSQVMKHYVGLPICWSMLFYAVWDDRLEKGGVMVSLKAPENNYHTVVCNIVLDKYPKMRVIDRGHRVWVEGTIRTVDTDAVYLQDGAQITLE
jgi:hypothetical protein